MIVDEVKQMAKQIQGKFKSIQVGKHIYIVDYSSFKMYMLMNDGYGNFT